MNRATRGLAVALSAAVMVAILAAVAWWRFAGYQTVTLVNIANFQSQLTPFEEASGDGLSQSTFGGAAYLAAAVADLRRKRPEALISESGDWVMGPWWRLFQGEPEFKVAKLIGVEVGMLGNHEFNLGTEHLKAALKTQAPFPILATNIRFDDPELAGLVKKDLILTTADGVKVGFFSLVPGRFTSLTKAGDGVHIESDLPRAARESILRLRDRGASVVVLLSHASLEEDLALAGEVEGLSLVVTGADHYGTEAALHWVRGPGGWATPVATGGVIGQTVTAFTLTFQRGRPQPESGVVETMVVSRELAPDLKVAEMVESYDRQLDDLLNQPIGAFAAPVDARKRVVRSGESGLGEFLADSFRWRTGSRLAVLNAGGIRGDRLFPAGPVSIKTVLEILPFGNKLVIKEMTGREVRQMLELSASALVGPDDRYVSADRMNSGGLLHFSGLRVTVALSPINSPALVDDDGRIISPGGRLKQVLFQTGEAWTTLNDTETYTVTMPDFLAAGGDRYNFLAKLPSRDPQVVDSDAVIDYLRSRSEERLLLNADGRLRIEGGK